MKKAELYEALERIGLVPVIKIGENADAAGLAKALMEGGLPVVEVTFRTSAATDAIRRIKSVRT